LYDDLEKLREGLLVDAHDGGCQCHVACGGDGQEFGYPFNDGKKYGLENVHAGGFVVILSPK
jgi:hypothetical protein